MNLDQKYPCIADLEKLAQKRIPRFSWDYMSGGIGREQAVKNNIKSLDKVRLTPRYLTKEADHPDCSKTLLGQTYSLPFGVAPIGLSGIIWPRASEHLARAAKKANIPFTLSSYSTSSIEQIGEISQSTRGNHWYQHYSVRDDTINAAMIERAKANHFDTLIITVDIPTGPRRDRDIRNGLSIPPRFNVRTVTDMLLKPRWTLEMLQQGVPEFLNVKPYLPPNASLQEVGQLLGELNEGHVTLEKLTWYRDQWPGKMLVKGILHPDEAKACEAIGMDGIVVSNHGGRQLDAASNAIECLSTIKAVVGPDFIVVADGGIRCGLDIARYIACGADFVLLGRAFMFAMAALGRAGADHAISILSAEFITTMRQLGCNSVADLPSFLESPSFN